MSSYLKQVIGPGEIIAYKAKVHWAIFLWPVLWTLLSLGLLAIVTVPWFFMALVRRFNTDLAATDKRIIAKTGLISRRVIEQRLAKVDSIRVDQGIMGRLLGYGTIYITGSGISATPIRNIAAPLDFKRAVELQLERYETETRSPEIPG